MPKGARLEDVVSEQFVNDIMQKLVDGVRRDIPKMLETGGRNMVKVARDTHIFNRVTGKADRSIKSEVDVVPKESASLTFFIDPSGVKTRTGYNRTWILNDGTRGNYRRGKISPTAQTVGGKAGTGIRHDDFIGRAWERQFPKTIRAVEKVFDRLK